MDKQNEGSKAFDKSLRFRCSTMIKKVNYMNYTYKAVVKMRTSNQKINPKIITITTTKNNRNHRTRCSNDILLAALILSYGHES